jgi:hypothetical protein
MHDFSASAKALSLLHPPEFFRPKTKKAIIALDDG